MGIVQLLTLLLPPVGAGDAVGDVVGAVVLVIDLSLL